MWAIERAREKRVPSMESLIRELDPFASAPVADADSGKRLPAMQRGRTLIGPWGVGQAKVIAPPQVPEARATNLAATADVVLWLKRKRSQHVRRTLLLAVLAVVALGLVAFSLLPRAERPPRAAAQRGAVQEIVQSMPAAALASPGALEAEAPPSRSGSQACARAATRSTRPTGAASESECSAASRAAAAEARTHVTKGHR